MADIYLDDDGNEIAQPVAGEGAGDANLNPPEELQNGELPNESDDDEGRVKAGETEGHDEELNGAADDDEREAIRERRREERRNRKLAQREREDTLRRELQSRDTLIDELRQKVNAIENRNAGSELAQIGQAKQQAGQAYAFFRDQIAIASEAGNHKAVAEATDKMLQAQRKFDELQNVEKAYKQRQAQPQALDPRLANHAKAWMADNKWYDPTGRDTDSSIALTLDRQMATEGWDPTTAEYWEELSARVKKYLPHRAKAPKMSTGTPRPIVAGSGRENSTSASVKGGYKVSADRVQAMKDAGIWDDPKARAEAIKRYKDYDKQQVQG